MFATVALLVIAQSKPVVQSFLVGKVERQATIIAPSRGAGSAPVVFVFHGHGGNMRNAQRSFHIEKYWPDALVVYPQGLPSKGKTDPAGIRSGWQQFPGDSDDRDLKFFDTMIEALGKLRRVDGKRIYVTGHSNGGRFSYVLWAKRGGSLAAAAPCAAPALGLFGDLKPLPAFIIAGEKDPIVPFASQRLSIAGIRRLLGTDPSRSKRDGLSSREPGSNGLELETYIFPGGHQVPSEALPKVVEFFKRHAQP